MIVKPNYKDAPGYCAYYFDLVTESNLTDALKNSSSETTALFSSIPPEYENYQYAPAKWTIKQVLQHVIDCERVYTYRAMRFSRFDATELPGFDENHYADKDNTIQIAMSQHIAEYKALREATIFLFDGMNDAMLDFKGKANELHSTARSWGWMAAGHNRHHCKTIKEKYLPAIKMGNESQ